MVSLQKTISALRREAAIYRSTLKEILGMAIDEELSQGGPLGYRIVEIISGVLRKKRPAHAGKLEGKAAGEVIVDA